MPRPKGSQNKVAIEVKELLESVSVSHLLISF